METQTLAPAKKDIRKASQAELEAFFMERGDKKFRAGQVRDWIWKKQATSFEGMTNLSQATRALLTEFYEFRSLEVDEAQQSNDGTIKSRFRLHDNELIEGVLIPQDDRMTACVSSQVGCSLTCKFCATGYLDRKRNLEPAEIYDQVVAIRRQAEENYGTPLTNIVFMGMGEPLLNYAQVLKAIERITAPDGFAMSPRRITVSTAGIAKMIRKLGDDEVKFRLALSLHAANDKKRNEIMSINEQNNLESLIAALNYFYEKTGNRISFEYILFDKFNDQVEDARQLIKLCKQVPNVRVNLIEYNTVEGVSFHKSKEDRAQFFCDYLNNHGVNATLRRSRGKDIDAACGQLANK